MPNVAALQVMVVDDMSTSRMLMISALQEIGFRQIIIAKGGKEALTQLQKSAAHLVVSDMNMPDLDGLSLLKALRSYKMKAKMAFILVTGSADKTLISRGRELGLNNFIAKPFTTPGVRNSIEAVLGPLK